jgi:release factor glutamine methyltransferase
MGTGSDIDARAVAVAQGNALAHGVASRVCFFVGEGLSALRAQFSLIVMNPPYISLEETPGIQEDVILYEPHSALFGGNDGLDIIKEILMNVGRHLCPGGVFVMEAGYRQKDAVEELVRSAGGIRTAAWIKDLSGIERVIIVERSDG